MTLDFSVFLEKERNNYLVSGKLKYIILSIFVLFYISVKDVKIFSYRFKQPEVRLTMFYYMCI